MSQERRQTSGPQCVHDTCGCNVGGDCECLCTAVSAYAQACLEAGVPTAWRSRAVCGESLEAICHFVQIFKCSTAALQCEAGSSYQPCVSTCPLATCDNRANYNKVSLACREEPCVEGCAPDTCRQGEVHQSRDVLKCINSINCRTKCRMENGTQFYEGDVMEESDCKSW